MINLRQIFLLSSLFIFSSGLFSQKTKIDVVYKNKSNKIKPQDVAGCYTPNFIEIGLNKIQLQLNQDSTFKYEWSSANTLYDKATGKYKISKNVIILSYDISYDTSSVYILTKDTIGYFYLDSANNKHRPTILGVPTIVSLPRVICFDHGQIYGSNSMIFKNDSLRYYSNDNYGSGSLLPIIAILTPISRPEKLYLKDNKIYESYDEGKTMTKTFDSKRKERIYYLEKRKGYIWKDWIK